jgi:tetratricopeptide (TPR) repeat protein
METNDHHLQKASGKNFRPCFLMYFVFCCLTGFISNAQNINIDSLLKIIAAEKNDSVRFYLAFSGLTESETNPVDDMGKADTILVFGQKHNDKICQFMGLMCLGYDYRAFGNTAKSLEYNLKSVAVAESSNDNRLIAGAYMGISTNYLDMGDYDKALAYCKKSLEKGALVEANVFSILTNLTMGEIYLNLNKPDSAMIYSQKAYEQSISTKFIYYLCGVYGQLGTVQAKLNNSTIALNYFNMALQEGIKINSPKYINIAYQSMAEFYFNAHQKDSAIMYSKKAIATVANTPFSTMTIKPAKLLLDIYRNNNVDSAFKYSEMHKAANDSLYNIKTMQQAQLMTFEEEARQQQLSVEKANEDEQRKQNIQYAIIAIGIIIFIILFLQLSSRFITNAKVISFLSVIALLIVFEFLNLLFSPFIENITHRTPIFMLLALVCIAAILAPLHHKIEKWTSNKLIEKNKAIRLANARKTIEKLAGQTVSSNESSTNV